MTILLSLPSDLTCAVISQWLKLKDVSLLDKAFCNHEEREILLKFVFRSPCCIVSHISYFRQAKLLLNWLMSRELRVDKLFVTRATVNDCVDYIEKFGRSICCIQIHECDLANAVCFLLLSATCKFSSMEDFILVDCTEDFTCDSLALDHAAPAATKVTKIALDVRQLRQTALNAIQHCIAPSQLQRLYVSFYDYKRNEGPSILQLLKQSGQSLRCLGVLNAQHIPENILIGAIADCPNILHLDVSYCMRLTDTSLEIVARHLTQLQTIIVCAYNLTDAGIAALALHRADTLQAFFVCGSLCLNGVGYNTLLEHCHLLHTLGIDISSPLTQALDTQLLGNIRTLQFDWLGGNETNLLLQHFTRLENLYIGSYDAATCQLSHLLRADSAPALRNIILDSTYGYRHGCIYSSIHDSSIFDTGSPLQDVALTALLEQRPHLHVRFDAGGD